VNSRERTTTATLSWAGPPARQAQRQGKKRPSEGVSLPQRSALRPSRAEVETAFDHFQLWIAQRSRVFSFRVQASISGDMTSECTCASTCAWRVLAMVEDAEWIWDRAHAPGRADLDLMDVAARWLIAEQFQMLRWLTIAHLRKSRAARALLSGAMLSGHGQLLGPTACPPPRQLALSGGLLHSPLHGDPCLICLSGLQSPLPQNARAPWRCGRYHEVFPVTPSTAGMTSWLPCSGHRRWRFFAVIRHLPAAAGQIAAVFQAFPGLLRLSPPNLSPPCRQLFRTSWPMPIREARALLPGQRRLAFP